MAYKIRKSRRAKSDIIEIGKYIAVEFSAPESASKLLDEIEVNISNLKDMPKMFPLVRDEELAKQGYRSMSAKNYLIFYTVDEETKTVNIVSAMYNRRDWTNLL
jgi:plasmid stabilization system protein ParE